MIDQTMIGDVEEETGEATFDSETGEASGGHPIEKLRAFMASSNIAADLPKDVLNKIGMEVTRGYDIDKTSRADWEKQTKTAMDLAMQVTEEKTWPWPKAANVKYPLITTAAIQFSARAYPAIVKGEDVVKGMVTGPDPDGTKKQRAERIGHHMSYQLLNEMEEWDEETDRLLMQIAIVGCAFRKSYFDKSMGRNCSDLVSAQNLVYNHAVPWNKLRRKTHEIFPFKNEVIEKVRGKLWVEIELGLPDGEDNDEDGSFDFLEQHCWYDLDDDGYKEPYVVTVRKETSEVVRIVARYDEDGIFLNEQGEIGKIKPVEYFTKYAFMPNPDGGSYDVGLGILLNPINETINSILNQMLDAGTLMNVGGGFIGNGLRMKAGSIKIGMGEYKPLENKGGAIRDNIYNIEHKGPSAVMFQLLGMLIEAGKDISSVKDILTGEQQVNQTATTTLALIEQGQKVFSAIYKRVHRSLKEEFGKLFRLNKLYMQPEEYFRFQDKSEPIFLEDYKGDETDVAPVSDPSLVSDAQHLTQAEALMKLVEDPAIAMMVNAPEILTRYLTAIKVENPEALVKGQQQDPEKMQMQDTIQKMDQAIQELTKEGEAKDQELSGLKMTTAIDQKQNALNTAEQMFEIERKAAEEALARQEQDAVAAIEQQAQALETTQQSIADKAVAEIQRIADTFMAKMDAVQVASDAESTKEDAAEPAEEGPDMMEMHREMMAEMMTAMQQAVAAITAPKRVVHDEKGRIVGVESVGVQ